VVFKIVILFSDGPDNPLDESLLQSAGGRGRRVEGEVEDRVDVGRVLRVLLVNGISEHPPPAI
jgi:hypothetical protein